VPISNPDKPMYPAAAFTKADVVRYYVAMAPFILPHLRDRPVTLKRYPDGVGRAFFYEKDAPTFTPPWVRTVPVPRARGGPDIRYVVIDDVRTLAWCAGIASLELHPFLHRAPDLDTPTMVVFDLDPGEGADVLTAARVAFLLKDVMDRLRLQCFPKVSGSKGVQVYLPLNTPSTYDVTQPFARAVAERLGRQHPDLVVADMDKALRVGKVLVDWSQNAIHKTTVAVYSLRAKRPRPYVSLPVTWDELTDALARRDAAALDFPPDVALERVRADADRFEPVLTLRQRLPRHFTPTVSRGSTPPRPTADRPAGTRRSRQGSRRRFVLRSLRPRAVALGLEMGPLLRSWRIASGVPRRGRGGVALEADATPLTEQAFGGPAEVGVYDVVDGRYEDGRLQLSLAGPRTRGQWTLERLGGPGERRWRIARVAARQSAHARTA
jgi:bifunctional non-homologous end joining protein LigD